MIRVSFHIAHSDQRDTYSGRDSLEVTDYCTNVSWSYSLNAPYESINLNMSFPLESYRRREVIPLTTASVPDTGFWVTINDEGQDGSLGVLRAWGRVDSVNVSVSADVSGAGIVCQAQVSATSWVWFVEDHHFTMTAGSKFSFSNVTFRGADQNDSETIKEYTDKFFIDKQSEITSLWEPLLIGAKQFKDSEAEPFIDQVKAIWKNFTANIQLPSSLINQGDKHYTQQPRASDIPLISTNNVVYEVMLEGRDKATLAETSRMGLAGDVPAGLLANAYFLPDGGVWSWTNSTFAFDANYIEFFPTLLPVTKRISSTTYNEDPLFVIGEDGPTEIDMVPFLIYRMKPLHASLTDRHHTSYLDHKGRPFTQPFVKQQEEPIYYPKYTDEELSDSAPYIDIPCSEVESFTFQVSENKKANVVATRRPYDGVSFGYAFSSIKPPELKVERLRGYGIRYQEMGWQIFYNDVTIYHYLNEYLFSLVAMQALGTGSFDIDYSPQILAGRYFRFKGEDSDPLRGFTGYVEEVTHSVSMLQSGAFSLGTTLSFSSGTWGDASVKGFAQNFGTHRDDK
jgi:hypothetical protein